ncbi:hypothetical protein AB0J90_30080 [Micromonospora sp. NPDC049523]|uniref:hypothetical protein n=1 Tax=Micromonospora sp. NPDC049523 TaxID=3155921 RepID=UPI00341EBB5E
MAVNTHRANCANAQRPGCECSGCGGSLHGWRGWTTLAADPPQVRDELRRQLENSVKKDQRSGRLSFNAHNRQAYLNLARLDVADHLWATGPRSTLDSRLPLDVDTADPASVSSDFDRVNVLTKAIMEDTWREISIDIDNLVQNEPNAREVKKGLANHVWCGLLVALIQLIEKIDKAIDFLSDAARQFIKDALSQHFKSGISRLVADAVINIVVDKVWSALTRLLEAHFPLLGTDTLRVLRILTVYTCPSVEQHPEVYKHAVEPLMADTHKIIGEEIKTQVTILFTAWWGRHRLDPGV